MNPEAAYLLEHELLKDIFDGLELDALNRAINADPSDDETRRASLGEVRAIQSVRRKLKALCAKTNPTPGAVV
jgi:hypothetical protein